MTKEESELLKAQYRIKYADQTNHLPVFLYLEREKISKQGMYNRRDIGKIKIYKVSGKAFVEVLS